VLSRYGGDDGVDGGVEGGAEFSFRDGADGLANGNAIALFDEGLARCAGVLLQWEDESAGGEGIPVQGCRAVVLLDLEFSQERLDGDAAVLVHGMGFDFGRAGPFLASPAQCGFGMVTGFFREEFFGAGVKGAEAAGAAEGSPLAPEFGSGGGEGEAAHDLVWFHGVTKQVTGAEFGAVAALVTSGFADGSPGRSRHKLALDDMMLAGQKDGAGGGFGDGRVKVVGGLAHHQAAEAKDWILGGGPASGGQAVAEGGADRDYQSDRPADRAGQGEDLVGDGFALSSRGDVQEGLHVVNDRPDLEWNPGRRNQAARHFVDQVVFVTSRVIVPQEMDFNGGFLASCLDRFNGVPVFGLDSDEALASTDRSHGEFHAGDQFLGIVFHDSGVLMQQGLAFGAVGDHNICLGPQLHVGGKTGPAGTHHTRLSDFFTQVHECASAHLCMGVLFPTNQFAHGPACWGQHARTEGRNLFVQRAGDSTPYLRQIQRPWFWSPRFSSWRSGKDWCLMRRAYGIIAHSVVETGRVGPGGGGSSLDL
jgi:hypothetical protein